MASNAPQDGQGSITTASESDWVRFYLMPKVLNRPNPTDAVITVDDAYLIEPEKIIKRIDETVRIHGNRRFFYTSRNYEEIYHIRTGNGVYSVTIGVDEDPKLFGVLHGKKTVGIKRKLRFFLGKDAPRTTTDWCIFEYRVNTEVLPNLGESKDTVLCILCNEPVKSANPSETEESFIRPSSSANMDDDNPPQTSTSYSSR